MRGAVAHAGWALRRPVGPTAASLVPSPPMRRKSVRGDVRYVYSVIEAHAVRYKQGATGREFGRTDRQPERTHPASPESIRSTNTPGLSAYQETKCVLVCTSRPYTLKPFGFAMKPRVSGGQAAARLAPTPSARLSPQDEHIFRDRM